MVKQSLLLRIKTLEPSLSAKEKQVAEFVCSDPKRAGRMTISDISAELGMAESTIFKFTRKLGYSGFRDFRSDLLAEDFDPRVSINENISAGSSPMEMAEAVFASSTKTLKATLAVLDEDELARAADLILGCRRLTFHGMGGSSIVAADSYHKFMRSPIEVRYSIDFHLQLMDASLATKDDCSVLFSHTGRCEQTIQIAELLKERGAKIIVVTGNPASPLAQMSDVVLVTVADETEYRSESLSSRIAQLAIMDTLYTIVMFNDEEASDVSLRMNRAAISRTRTGA